MGILDDAKKQVGDLFGGASDAAENATDAAGDAASGAADAAGDSLGAMGDMGAKAVDAGSDKVDSATGGQFSQPIDSASDTVEGMLDKDGSAGTQG